MKTTKPDIPASPAAASVTPTDVSGAIAHAEPKHGGSYIRDLDTGALVPNAEPTKTDPSEE